MDLRYGAGGEVGGQGRGGLGKGRKCCLFAELGAWGHHILTLSRLNHAVREELIWGRTVSLGVGGPGGFSWLRAVLLPRGEEPALK